MKKQRREEKGITLVALVVTIIVLIILAGVTLNIVLDNDGIINKAKQAAEDYENAQREEQEILGQVENYIENAGKIAPIPEGYTKSQITTEDDIGEGLVIYEIPEGANVNWTDEEDEKGNNQSTITIGETTTNLQETVNQYVWIPVDDINSMVMCSSNTEDGVCSLVYDKYADTLTCKKHLSTATDLVGRLYTTTETSIKEGNNTIYSYTMDFSERDQTFDKNGYREPDIVSYDSNNGLNIEQLKNDFLVMIKSVAKYGGFYISRYEIGENGNSKKEQLVLTAETENGENYLGANTWYGLYNTIRKIDENKQMIWGCQYDQVIKFIKENGEDPENGHCDRNLTTNHALSGQNELDKMKNIYDLEGNHWEWTLEAYSTGDRTGRSNDYRSVNNGNFYPTSGRYSDHYPAFANNNRSSRSVLYL